MYCLWVKWMTAIYLSKPLQRKKNIIMWLIVCCFQRKQTFRILDESVLEGEELDFPKILCCWNHKWKNPQLHLFSYIGLDLYWEMQQHESYIHTLFLTLWSNCIIKILCSSYSTQPPPPPPPIFLMPDIKLHGLAFEAQYSSFWASVWILLIGIICSSFFPSLLFKTSKWIMHLCWHLKKKSVYLLYARLSPHHWCGWV